MKIDYHTIKAISAETGINAGDLIVLSSDNDPFYAERPQRKVNARWFADLWERFGFQAGAHIRRIHYVLISQETPILKPDGKPYENTINDWHFLGKASLTARYLKLIPAGSLVDRRNDEPIINATNPGSAAPRTVVYGEYGAGLEYQVSRNKVSPPLLTSDGFSARQDFLVELWIEKSTMNDVLVPLAARLGVNLVPGTGETSEILARQSVERAVDDGRPMRILYISDFDPGGRSMPVALARKIQFWVQEASPELDVTLQPIVLTPEQCEQYRLPRTPLKETERRAAKFEARFGSGATELDALEALHPGELARIVENEVCRYLDVTLLSRMQDAEWRFDREINRVKAEVLTNYDISELQNRYDASFDDFESELQAIEAETEELWPQIAKDLEEAAPEFDPDDLPKPKPATPPDDPLFDSKRSYQEQLDHYRSWQGRGGAS